MKIERESEVLLARRREETVPQWVNALTEESSAWEFLKPKEKKKKKKKKRKLTQEEFPDDDDDDDDDETLLKAKGKATSWPKYVKVVSLSRVRPPCSVENTFSAEQLSTYSATYRQDAADGPVDLDKIILTPMVIHRNLAIHYQKRMVEGYNHEEVMDEISEYCGVPVVWRGCRPFTGTFEPVRLRRAWMVNWTMWTLLLAWLAWSFLSLRDLLPWPDIIATLLLGTILKPTQKLVQVTLIGFVVWLILEGPNAYAQYRANQTDPDAQIEIVNEKTDPLVEGKTDLSVTAEDEDGEVDAAKSDAYKPPPPVAMVTAKTLAATARPEQAYEAMHTGAVLRELDERKHLETTAVARELVPKLEAQQKRHNSEIAQLDAFRVTCTEDDAIERIDAAKAEKEARHQATLKEIEAEVRTCPLSPRISVPLDRQPVHRKRNTPHTPPQS